MSELAPNTTRASFEVARVALGRMLGEAPPASELRTVPVTMAVRANDAWKAVEHVLRTITGRTELAGQSLLTEARRIDALDMEGMHALVALREWVERTLAPGSAAQMLTLAPTEAEKDVARNALTALERTAGITPSGAPATGSAPTADSRFDRGGAGSRQPVAPASEWAQPATGVPSAKSAPPSYQAPSRSVPPTTGGNARDAYSATGPGVMVVEPAKPASRSAALIMGAVALVVVLVAGGAWYALRGSSGGASAATAEGVAAYGRGSKEAARLAFVKAVEENPNDVRALIYLGRISRDLGNLATARKYLEEAIRIEPRNSLALREFASALLADQQPELARRFYVRAIEAKPDDRVAQGFLGCALMRLGREEEAQRWYSRAGTGEWSTCNTAAAASPVAKD